MVYIYKTLGKEDQLKNTCNMIENTLADYKNKNIKDYDSFVNGYIHNGTCKICKN